MPSMHEGILDVIGGELPSKKTLSPWRILRSIFSLSWPSKSDKPLRSTAYLDGLRGFAAFLVYWHHHELFSHVQQDFSFARFEHAWGWKDHFHFATFPWIRNFFSGGHIAVATFYVISGYVLSVKPLSLIQNGEHLKVADNLASAFFRRWFRLFIPIIVTTFLFVTSWHVLDIWVSTNEKQATYGAELYKWYVEFKNFSFLFKENQPWVEANRHLWSIGLEMRGSVIVYMALLAFMRATTKARLLCECALIYYFLYIVDGYYGALFMAGMLQADLDLLARRNDGEFPSWLRRLERYKTFIVYHLFFIGTWLSGVPSFTTDLGDLADNPGWHWAAYLKPQAVYDYKWFYLFFASNMIVASVPRIGWVKYFFETRFCQYLGRISYALYLMHGPILNTLGDRLYFAVGLVRPIEQDLKMLAPWVNAWPLPKTGPLGLEVSFLVPHIILLPFTIWMADLVTRHVDEPAVKIAQWMYRKTLAEKPQEKPENAMRLA
ncbi:acyltransferase family-domain-containing protein [Coniochaeta sp. 2T2.1]|nr:acyltransferase family-domain-containing protein [Coniochaeta sp. 2T2.1]